MDNSRVRRGTFGPGGIKGILWNLSRWWTTKRAKKISIDAFVKQAKSMSKAQLIDELVYQASVINKNEGQFRAAERKELRQHSKRKLVKALLILKLYSNKSIGKRLEKSFAEGV